MAVTGLSEKALTLSKSKKQVKQKNRNIADYYQLNIYEHVPECAQVKWDIWMKNQMLNYIWLFIT